MNMPLNDNKRIARNTIYLYARTMVVLFVSLYTSRLVFKALGEIDMGIYNVVAGIVTLMTFLQATQAQATSRFITFELGSRSDHASQNRIISICFTIHVLIAIGALILTETIGLWMVNHLISIPPERMRSANVIYQFAILTLIIQTVRVPLDAIVIAHERMSAYAFITVLESLVYLANAILLRRYGGDRLCLYGALIALAALFLFLIYLAYVRSRFHQYRFRWLWDKKQSLQVLSFSGWTLLGSGTDTMTQQGVSLLMNHFVSLVANTALGFAQQVNNAVKKFVTSFSTAFNPQVIKLYAGGDDEAMHRLIRRASKFSFALCYILVLPLIANMPFVLSLWLGEVPEYTVSFCRMILVCTVFDSITGVFYTAIAATGRIKHFQIFISISFLLDLLCAYLLLIAHFHPGIVFGSRIITRGLINMLIELYFMRKLLGFDLKAYEKDVILPVLATLAISAPVVALTALRFSGWKCLLISTGISVLLTGACFLFIIMDKRERTAVTDAVKTRWKALRRK